MRATVLAAILAVSLAGFACSEKAPAENEQPAETSESAQPQQGQFNLRFPTNDTQPASSGASGEFNLRIPESADAGMDSGGLRLPEGAVREDALSGIQEIQTPGVVDPQPEEDPEDDIIRLD